MPSHETAQSLVQYLHCTGFEVDKRNVDPYRDSCLLLFFFLIVGIQLKFVKLTNSDRPGSVHLRG